MPGNRILPSWRRVLGAVGRASISAGILILLCVAYQLWGTGVAEARAQDRLRADFRADVERRPQRGGGGPPPPPEATTTTATPARASPEGEAIAILRIPRIDLEKAVVEGVSVEALKRGPGHYPGTPLPGNPGNAAIAGHRTTYGAPFLRLDELRPGDRIEVTTRDADATYEVTGSRVVNPTQNEVLEPTPDNRLTLTTCHPRYSAAERLIVTARLLDEPVMAPPDTPGDTPPPQGQVAALSTEDLSGEPVPRWPAAAWGGLAAAIWSITAFAARRWRRFAAYAIGAPVFLVVLFVFFENVARLLPANI